MINSRTIAYLELTAAAILIGSSVVAGKWTTMQMPVFLSQAVSLAIALMLLIPIVWMSRTAKLSLGKKDLLYLFLQSFLGMFLFRVLLLYGLKTAPAAEAGILTSFTPAAVAVLSFIFLKERLTAKLSIGIMCSLLGIISIQLPGWFVSPPLTPTLGSSFGLILILAAVCGEAMLTILRKMTASSVSSLIGTTYVTLFSFVMFAPFALVEASQYDFTRISMEEIGLVLYYGIFVTAVAYLLWFRGVAKVSAGTAAVYTGCIPISTLLLSYAVLHEPFSMAHLVGGAFVFLGVWYVSRNHVSESRLAIAEK
ncbi:DMT family transporter [Paenibacillus sp. UNC451MF]|uniref:DMT family transporter n=1 Tax=Paenibacillus sp. UNC451MF TaxID=1449063 RepID=UPI000ACA93F0|nr:DMT family transporter [Paenibacillus sp. UNC451MF]